MRRYRCRRSKTDGSTGEPSNREMRANAERNSNGTMSDLGWRKQVEEDAISQRRTCCCPGTGRRTCANLARRLLGSRHFRHHRQGPLPRLDPFTCAKQAAARPSVLRIATRPAKQLLSAGTRRCAVARVVFCVLRHSFWRRDIDFRADFQDHEIISRRARPVTPRTTVVAHDLRYPMRTAETMENVDVSQLVERLGADEESVKKMAVFKLQNAIGDPSFAELFIQEGGVPKLRYLALHATGNTLAYCLTSLSRLLELDKGWDHITDDLIKRVSIWNERLWSLI